MTLTREQAQHLQDKMESGFSADVLKETSAKYYTQRGRINVYRVFGHEYSYLEHATGNWVRHASVCDSVTGYRGDASTHEISKSEAQAWVKKNHPGLSVEWL